MNSEQYRYIVDIRNKIEDVFRNSFNIELDDDVSLFIACQSALETGYGSSSCFRVNYNLFGMKNPSIRPTLSCGVLNNHSSYLSYIDSVIDYFWWMLWNKFSFRSFSSLPVFTVHLINGRFNPSSKYVDKINSIVASFKKFEKNEC